MDNLNFENDKMKFDYNGKVCFIAKQVAEVFNHDEPSKAINRAIKDKNMIQGLDFELLEKEELKDFKEVVRRNSTYDISRAPKLVVLYEEGLEKFIGYLSRVLNLTNVGFTKKTEGIKTKVKYDTLKNNEDILTNKFKDKEVHTIIYKGKPCWVATEIAEVLGYKRISVAVNQCIVSEEFEKGVDYDVLTLKEIKELIPAICDTHITSGEQVRNLSVFYKEGLLGFINYSHMPIGKEFRKWLRTEVFSELIDLEVGNTMSENKFSIKRDNLSKDTVDNIKNKDSLSDILGLINTVDKIVDENESLKVAYLSKLLDRI